MSLHSLYSELTYVDPSLSCNGKYLTVNLKHAKIGNLMTLPTPPLYP